jgi:putative restriction endonuclease
MSDRHAQRGAPNISAGESFVIERLMNLRQHRQDGKRSPHKPLLVLLALARLAAVGSSALTWSDTRHSLGALLMEFGPTSTTSPKQAAAYPFTRLRSDGLWTLDQDVPMDRVGPLESTGVTGRLLPSIERAMQDRRVLYSTARALVESEFPPSIAGDVLAAVGLDPDEISGLAGHLSTGETEAPVTRRRSGDWPRRILSAWDRQCAFCGFDGQLGMGSVGLEAAHVRWFNFGGPDSLDNGIALCALHHKLFDRGALGLSEDYRIVISSHFTARTDAGRRVYELADRSLRPKPGTRLPSPEHVHWHATQVFKDRALTN